MTVLAAFHGRQQWVGCSPSRQVAAATSGLSPWDLHPKSSFKVTVESLYPLSRETTPLMGSSTRFLRPDISAAAVGT